MDFLISLTKIQIILLVGGGRVELMFNDLSLVGQFPDFATFKISISNVMNMRDISRKFGREISCHRNVAHARVCHNLTMQQAINIFDKNEQRALTQWITRLGPFWEDRRSHNPDDYLECNGEVVTDTAVGEAAYCGFHGSNHQLISLVPSTWGFSPLNVAWILSEGVNLDIAINNYWDVNDLETALRAAPALIISWEQLEAVSRLRFSNLTFSADSFNYLRGLPFADGAAKQLLTRFDTLDRFKCCFDDQGQRTAEGQRLYQDHFTGENGWFSDSSDKEKVDFKADLTFPHPDVIGDTLFCTWHGKVKVQQLRIHFSWPIQANTPLYVVYVGQKRTKL